MYDYLRKAVKNFPTKSAIIYKNVEITYDELNIEVKKLVNGCFTNIRRCNIGIVINNPLLFNVINIPSPEHCLKNPSTK